MMSVFCGDFLRYKKGGKKGQNVLWDLEKETLFSSFPGFEKENCTFSFCICPLSWCLYVHYTEYDLICQVFAQLILVQSKTGEMIGKN